MAGNTVKVTLLADAKGFQRGMKEAEKSTKGFQDKAKVFSGAVQGIFAGAAVAAVVGFAKESIAAFSNLEQSAGAVESVFGSAADGIVAKAKTAAEEFGLSTSEFQASAATLGAQLKNQLGLDVDEAADKTTDLIGVASDLAAQFGGSTSDAVAALSSLMRGERDPIEKYGVSMNEAAIQAKALEEGLADANGEIGPQAKAAAALEIVYEQTADAAGAFGREADTIAGQLQRSQAKFEDLKAEIGEGLAPAFGLAMDAAAALEPVIESLTSAFDGATEAIDPLIDELTTLLGVAPESGVGLETVGHALATTVLPFLGPVIAGVHNINEALGLNAEKNRDAVRAMEDTRTHGVEPLAEAQDDLAGKTVDVTGAMREQFDLIDGRLDVFGRLTGAVDDQAEAQQAVNDAIGEFGKGSPEHIAAVEDLAGANRDVADAEIAVREEGGMTRAEFVKQQTALGLTREDAELLADTYDRLFTPRTVVHTIRTREIESHEVRRSSGRQHGGPVQGGRSYLVGEAGPEVIVPAAAGNVVPLRPASTAPSAVYNVTINAGLGSDPNAISRAVVEALQRYERGNGAIPIRTLR